MRGVLFRGRGFSDVRKIRTHPLFPEQHRATENVIARGAAALAPFRTRLRRSIAFSIEVGSSILGAELLAVAINAAVGSVNVAAALGHSRLRHWIDIGAFFVGLRLEMSDLQIRN